MGKHREGSNDTGASRSESPEAGQNVPPVGTLAEEATQLFAVLSGIARDQAAQYSTSAESMTAAAVAAVKSVNEHIATGDAECVYCPICRVVHAARSASPEAKAHLSTALLSLAQAASALMAPPTAASPSGTSGESGSGMSDEDPSSAAPADGALHKINLGDESWERD